MIVIMPKKNNQPSPVSRTLIHQGPTVNLGEEHFILPDGRLLNLDIVRHPGGAAIAAIDAQGQVCLLRQYRHAAGGWIWELPAGKLDPEETPENTARRELAEEAGLQANQWQALGSVLTTPGFCDERIHLFLAHNLTRTDACHQDNELIEVHFRPFAEALQWVYSGQITDAKSMLGLLLAAAQLEQSKP